MPYVVLNENQLPTPSWKLHLAYYSDCCRLPLRFTNGDETQSD